MISKKLSLTLFLWILIVLGMVGIRRYTMIPKEQARLLRDAMGNKPLADNELRKLAQFFVFQDPELTPRDRELAHWGRELFFETGLSKNGKISCATCHKPELSFTDGKTTAQGLTQRDRNTPTIINSFSSFWFYWDGRTDSLAAQSLNPIEDEGEQGLTRSELAFWILNNSRSDYENLFGPFPKILEKALPFKARPLREHPQVSDGVVRNTMVSADNPKLLSEIGSNELTLSTQQIRQFRQKLRNQSPQKGDVLSVNYWRMNREQRFELDRVFSNVGLAFEAFEKGIVARDSAFDQFIRRWMLSSNPDPRVHFSEKFNFSEFLGFQIFLGKGACHVCHSGPYFKDNQFHNIGLPQSQAPFDLGRSLGVLTVKKDRFNCQGIFSKDSSRQKSESCRDLNFLDSETPEAIGSFKTPTLRNVAETAPYMRDGRLKTLREVLEHYNKMETHSGVGFREETLKPLNLSEHEIAALEDFLRSLSSRVEDLNL